MESIGSYLDRMVITASSPDGHIRARVSNYFDVDLAFRPRTYQRYLEEDLAHQLGRLGVSTWVAYHRGRSEAYRLSQGFSPEDLAAEQRERSSNPRHAAYDQALNAIEAQGSAAGGAIRVRTVGMMRWQVTIRPGTVGHLDEASFVAEAKSAIRALLADREGKIILVKAEHFDLGIPQEWIDRSAQARRGADARRQRHR